MSEDNHHHADNESLPMPQCELREAVQEFMPLAQVAFLWTKETPPEDEVERYRQAYWKLRAALAKGECND
jgi:hypothetical protein